MENGELVLIDYVGKADGEIFDLSDEEKAEEHGINKQGKEFKPIPVLVGEDYVIEGLEEEIQDMEVGEEREVEIPAEKAYGKREADNMDTFPEKEFEKQGVQVNVGEQIQIGRRTGRVISKGSGRVRIDFNHPLAGKDLEYWVRVNEKVEDDEEKARKIFEYRLGHGEIEFDGNKATIVHKHEDDGHSHELPEEMKDGIREEITQFTSIEEVEFDE
ncbi:FKBP-type peptidyl-prolyl cis-trans isomerase [Candidatus Nanohalobium constans]|uniref:Peptidyl-prolyl cis-trans isomerase n=1 Tax=Candidatus Nanohalobium constans TaxID=2565781 RepID=A0A5Q0UEV2_9ARCH|nr:FKBP-type peptidyl-prolyl cis-trans isomerase [Candidatus Nanohalobium constans]QGA80014.1 FKBP-type peptidyl-prolyl cis-trans isomerase SlyD [Candidatus Nanohalobium constans]